LVWFEAKGQKNIGLVWGQRSKKHWSGLRPKVKKTLPGLRTRIKKTSLVFGRGVRFYRYIFEIVRGWCFLDKRGFFKKKTFLYKVWPEVFGVAESEFMRGFLFHSRPISFFGAWSSANQVISLSHSRPIRFFGSGSSAHQVLSLSHTGPIRFFRIGSSCNRVVFYWESNQSGNFAIRLSSSQAFQAVHSVNRDLCGCDISRSGFFLGKRSANQLSWA
jgi:hypothetical protein